MLFAIHSPTAAAAAMPATPSVPDKRPHPYVGVALTPLQREALIERHLGTLQRLAGQAGLDMPQVRRLPVIALVYDEARRGEPDNWQQNIRELLARMGRAGETVLVTDRATRDEIREATFADLTQAVRAAVAERLAPPPAIPDNLMSRLARHSLTAAAELSGRTGEIAATVVAMHRNGLRLTSLATMYSGRFMPDNVNFCRNLLADVRQLIGWCTREGKCDAKLFHSVALMQQLQGIPTEAAFQRLLKLSTNAEGALDHGIATAIATIQAGHGMLSEEGTVRMRRQCSLDGQPNSPVDERLASAMANMQFHKGLMPEADFERFKSWCRTPAGEFDWALMRGVSSMQKGHGMIAQGDFDRLVALCTVDGTLDHALLRSITGMQAGKGMLSEDDQRRLVARCARATGQFDPALLRDVASKRTNQGVPTDAEFDALARDLSKGVRAG